MRGWLWGSRGRQGPGSVFLPMGDMAIIWRELCPCLNPLGATGKRPGDPEHGGGPYGLLSFLISFGRATGSFTPLCLLVLPSGRTGKQPGHRDKKEASYLGSEGKKQLRIRAWMHF
jgi:hypothetical protein